jgi:hypothetical protein
MYRYQYQYHVSHVHSRTHHVTSNFFYTPKNTAAFLYVVCSFFDRHFSLVSSIYLFSIYRLYLVPYIYTTWLFIRANCPAVDVTPKSIRTRSRSKEDNTPVHQQHEIRAIFVSRHHHDSCFFPTSSTVQSCASSFSSSSTISLVDGEMVMDGCIQNHNRFVCLRVGADQFLE